MPMSSTSDVYGTEEMGIGTITLNRPERRNAMNDAMIEGLGSLLETMEASEDVRVIVITGAGGAFCAGGDVLQFDDQGGEGYGSSEVDPLAVELQLQQQRVTVGRIYQCGKPVLASLPGAAAGAGMGFALAADLRIGSPRALMTTAFGAVGLSGDYGVTWLLDRLVGPAKAREMLFLGTRINAEECFQLGLLNWLVSEGDLESRTASIAARLADGPVLAYRNMKKNLLCAQETDLFGSMDMEVGRHKQCGLTADHINAVRAFAEKRTPTFGSDQF